MKYLLEEWGVDKFRETVEGFFGKQLSSFKPLPAFRYEDFLGWNEQGDGKLFLGISVENGRIKDEGSLKLRTALREIVQQFNLPSRLTPHQNIILYEIEPTQREAIQQLLDQYGVPTDPASLEPLVRYSMACPALPTCGLAITESERIIPSILERIRKLLDKLGLEQEHFVVRMTGCPNGCARPYLAELAFVGSAPEIYQVWLGGSPDQTRLAKAYLDRVHHNDLESELEPIFTYFKKSRQASESFGDFCDRVGFDAIRQFTVDYESEAVSPQSDTGLINEVVAPPESSVTKAADKKIRRRISVGDEIYTRLKEASTSTGKPLTQLATEAIDAYLKANGKLQE